MYSTAFVLLLILAVGFWAFVTGFEAGKDVAIHKIYERRKEQHYE